MAGAERESELPERVRVQRLTDVASLGEEGEHVEVLLAGTGWRLERIISRGQTTPEGQWYDQEEDEWVAVLAGSARLEVAGQVDLELGAGDAVLLPAHRRHRVSWTDETQATVWVALFADSSER
ncbi:MAG: cupin domain-containing protein [Candidatus Nanopelagicales bacterium]|nr:cupin domain-containing protein [Candidatus Nanopelagicales bacterium]MDZ4249521.1 cupin domain-containing protein [Candidatus Nanopelagicales bacterium]